MKEADIYLGRTVLITGGTGFLGLNLVAALREAGADVRTLSRSDPPAGTQIHHFRGDLRDRALVEQAIEASSVIFNLAGHSGSISSNTEPFEDLDVNLRGHLTLLEACRHLSQPPTIVFPSSRLVYRPTTQMPVPETWLTGPLSLYGVHKLAAEHYHLLYAHLYGLKVAVLRITNPYGYSQHPIDDRYSIINWFIRLAVTDKVLPVYGEGRQLRDYVHVDDVVRAFLLAGTDARAAGQIFNVGSGAGVSFREMAETVVREAGKGRIEPRPWPDEAARVETGDFVADVTRIHQTLGWRPATAFGPGLSGVIRQYRQMENVR
jgi:nucleoside-diphosphate-sugar epimerase